MIKETGKIIEIKNVAGKKTVAIECISRSACSSCQSQSNCGVGVVSKGFSNKQHYIEVEYQEGMKVDQSIELQIENSDLVKGAMLAYLFPLVLFIGTAIITFLLGLPEIVIILTSFLFGGIAYYLINVFFKHSASFKKISVYPKATKVSTADKTQ